MTALKPFYTLALTACLLTLTAVEGTAQDLRQSLFQDTDELAAEARAAGAQLLAPDNFADGTEYYEKAAAMFDKNKSIESIRNQLSSARTSFKEATRLTALARVTLADLIKLREAAVQAQAETYAPGEWAAAESAFLSASRTLEGGDVKRAENRAAKAAPLFLEAELMAIQNAILGEARARIEEANKAKVGKFAPETLAKAERLAERSAQLLAEDRYDTTPAIRLAADAEYEARHASYLAGQAQRLKNKEVTTELLLLEWEAPLAAIAAATEASDDFSNGFSVPTEAALARIEASRVAGENSADQVRQLTTRVEQLEEQLGVTTRRAEASELRRQQVASLEALFSRDEATVVQEKGQVIVRMIGLNFATGQAVIESRFFGLLRKLDEVPDIFPGARLVVEGHTDAQGNDTMNLSLSERRANSVRDYLLAATALKASSIEAIGYGKSRPIANNETAEGRAMNRRTDVVIVPPGS